MALAISNGDRDGGRVPARLALSAANLGWFARVKAKVAYALGAALFNVFSFRGRVGFGRALLMRVKRWIGA